MIRKINNEKGVAYIELLVSIILLIVIVLAAFSYSSYGFGGVGQEGNRRAALEVARARMEQLMQANMSAVRAADTNLWWLTCAGAPCTWTMANAFTAESVNVGSLTNLPMVTTTQFIDDPVTGNPDPDTVEFTVKVWFTLRTGIDDEYNRVLLRTLRT